MHESRTVAADALEDIHWGGGGRFAWSRQAEHRDSGWVTEKPHLFLCIHNYIHVVIGPMERYVAGA